MTKNQEEMLERIKYIEELWARATASVKKFSEIAEKLSDILEERAKDDSTIHTN